MAERAKYAGNPIAHLRLNQKPNPVPIPTTVERKAAINFYTCARWRKLRATLLAQHPLCALCLERGETKLGEDVHHLKKRADHPELAYEVSNLQVLCKSCHSSLDREHH